MLIGRANKLDLHAARNMVWCTYCKWFMAFFTQHFFYNANLKRGMPDKRPVRFSTLSISPHLQNLTKVAFMHINVLYLRPHHWSFHERGCQSPPSFTQTQKLSIVVKTYDRCIFYKQFFMVMETLNAYVPYIFQCNWWLIPGLRAARFPCSLNASPAYIYPIAH